MFITRLDANGPAAVDVTIRHTLKSSAPLSHAERVPEWQEAQERDKTDKHGPTARRHGWSFVPLLLDCYGSIGPQGLTFLNTLHGNDAKQRMGYGKKSPSRWRGNSPGNLFAASMQKTARILTPRQVTPPTLPLRNDPLSPPPLTLSDVANRISHEAPTLWY